MLLPEGLGGLSPQKVIYSEMIYAPVDHNDSLRPQKPIYTITATYKELSMHKYCVEMTITQTTKTDIFC